MNEKILSGDLLDTQTELSLADLCNACSSHAEWIIELVDEGILEPIGQIQSHWRFSAISLHRVHIAMRLQRDLKINCAGVALAIELLDEIETLRTRLQRLEKGTGYQA